MPRVFASGPHDMRTRNNPGNAQVCQGLQVPMILTFMNTIKCSNSGISQIQGDLFNACLTTEPLGSLTEEKNATETYRGIT